MCIALCTVFLATAQNSDYKHTITLGTGASFLGVAVNNISGTDFASTLDDQLEGITNLNGLYEGSASLPFGVNYDYGATNWFSIGGGIAFQRFNNEISDLSYTRAEDNESIDIATATIDINRINVAARVLFHYGNKGKIDMYSGLRLGVTNWGTKVEASNPALEEDLNATSFIGLVPSVQLIPFALRGYITENLGLSFETGIGTPHFFAIGLNYRL